MSHLARCATCHELLSSTGRCKRCQTERVRVAEAAARLLGRTDVFILDTETTGLKNAEVIELALVDTTGAVRLNTLIKPQTQVMNPHAERVHGISLRELDKEPSWPEVLPEFVTLTQNATVLAWNAPFDARMLEQTSARWGLPHPKLLYICAMRLYARTHGRSSYGLHKAVTTEGLEALLTQHTSHRALGDVVFVLELLRRLAQR